MFTFRTRRRRWWLGAIATALVVSLAALLLRSMLEHAVRARIESAALRNGVVARIGLVHVGVWPLLRLEGFDLDLGHGVRLHADMIAATWPWEHTAGAWGRWGITPTTSRSSAIRRKLPYDSMAPGAGSGARSRSPRSTRRWPVPPCRARSHCEISTPIRLSI